MALRLSSTSSPTRRRQPCTHCPLPLALLLALLLHLALLHLLHLALLHTSLRHFLTLQTHAIVLLQSSAHLAHLLLPHHLLPPCLRPSDNTTCTCTWCRACITLDLSPCLHRQSALVYYYILHCSLSLHVACQPMYRGSHPDSLVGHPRPSTPSTTFTSPNYAACRHEPPAQHPFAAIALPTISLQRSLPKTRRCALAARRCFGIPTPSRPGSPPNSKSCAPATKPANPPGARATRTQALRPSPAAPRPTALPCHRCEVRIREPDPEKTA